MDRLHLLKKHSLNISQIFSSANLLHADDLSGCDISPSQEEKTSGQLEISEAKLGRVRNNETCKKQSVATLLCLKNGHL